MSREARRPYGKIRLLDITCDAPYDWRFEDATHVRVSMPVCQESQEEMTRRGFVLADRTIGCAISLARGTVDFASLVRTEPQLTSGRREEILAIAKQCFPADRRFHVAPALNQAIADEILAGWVDELPPCYLYGHKGQSVGFLALTGEGDRRFVHLAAVLERYRASGAALSLYAAAARDCKSQGVRFLEGRISTANPAVMNLYAFLGAKFSQPVDVYLKEV